MGKGVTDEKGNLLPPPLVVRLKSMAVKVALFKCKRDALPKPSEAEMAAGIRKLLLVEDLTLPTLHKLKELKYTYSILFYSILFYSILLISYTSEWQQV